MNCQIFDREQERADFSRPGSTKADACAVPARVVAGGINRAHGIVHASRCAAERGADGASAPSLPMTVRIISHAIVCQSYNPTDKPRNRLNDFKPVLKSDPEEGRKDGKGK